ncbi:M23 family metallopeptidase [Roseateles chitosanitabidus]|uniref:M23 family metallopeptidase n=1 Tax=Roseateles chitosanitabidus TaxID=65048 RepID=UPI000833451D|nr:peptidoglycan DD-metalloendopeptidase family protein [Roseateles chitosanitabidus]MBO9686939.1 M23 family metallopeptidase [Roseateles chitosanitabidus]
MNWKDEWQRVQRSLARAEAFAAKHPRALTGTVVGTLSCFAVTAFGIAPMAPDAEDLPQRVISESIPLQSLDEQLAQLAAFDPGLSRSDQTRAGDTADTLLKRMGAFDTSFAAFLRSDDTAKKLLSGRTGKRVQVVATASGEVQSLVARYAAEASDQQDTQFTRLSITRDGDRFVSKLETVPLQSQTRLGSGTIQSSLFAATDEANVPDAIATQLADMFSGDIDFHRELRKGDRFSVVYETLTADGEPVNWGNRSGRLLAAEFVNNGKSYQSVWFRDAASGKSNYYGFDGESKRRSFLASPLEFSRVTSGFAMRFHPILQTWRQHQGVDLGAPSGTPVRSVGDGNVEFAGWQNGFGNVIQLKHSGNRMTVYAHLSRIDVKKGQKIEQGQKIGAVGATGWATGPHLHFEFRVNGKQQDPRVIAKASEALTLPATAKAAFKAQVASAKVQLEAAATINEGVVGE